MDELSPQIVIHGDVFKKEELMNSRKKCVCGRSKTGFCDGSHSLDEDYRRKKSEYIASNLAAQFPGSMFSEEVRLEKAKIKFKRPSLDLSELDAFIHTSFSRGCRS